MSKSVKNKEFELLTLAYKCKLCVKYKLKVVEEIVEEASIYRIYNQKSNDIDHKHTIIELQKCKLNKFLVLY